MFAIVLTLLAVFAQVAELQFRGVIAATSSRSSFTSSASGNPPQHRVTTPKAAADSAASGNTAAGLSSAAVSTGKLLQRAKSGNTQQHAKSGSTQQHASTGGSPDLADASERLTAELAQEQTAKRRLLADCDVLKRQLAEARKEVEAKEGHLQGLQVSM